MNEQLIETGLAAARGIGIALLCFFVARALAIGAQNRLRIYQRNQTTKGNNDRARLANIGAELFPGVITVVAIIIFAQTIGIDTSTLGGFLTGAGFGLMLMFSPIGKHLVAGVINILFHVFAVDQVIQTEHGPGIIRDIGWIDTRVYLPHKRACIIIPNNQLLDNAVLNYDAAAGSMMTAIVPIDTPLTDIAIDKVESTLTKAIRKWSIKDGEAHAVFINVAADAYEFELRGFVGSPMDHPSQYGAMYKAAVKAALRAGYSVGRTNNNSFNGTELVIKQ